MEESSIFTFSSTLDITDNENEAAHTLSDRKAYSLHGTLYLWSVGIDFVCGGGGGWGGNSFCVFS